MHPELSGLLDSLALIEAVKNWFFDGYLLLKVLIGFSIIICVHELGHFLAAKAMGVRVERFAVGFFYRFCGYRRGEGFTFGRRPSYKPEELAAKDWGETDYCLNALPFGGYVKMMGEDDIVINEKTGAVKRTDDPRAFPNKSVGRRMVIVSAGVLFNAAFAVVLYALVFLTWGKEMPAPVIGRVEAGSPAASAGFLPGDRVLAIDGQPVQSFEDVLEARLLADKPLHLRIERGGQVLPKTLVLPPGRSRAGDLPRDLAPMLTTQFSPTFRTTGEAGPRPGDTVTQVNGVPVHSAFEILVAFQRSGGRPLEFTAERPEPQHPGSVHAVTYTQRPVLELAPALEGPPGDPQATDSEHLLGFRRRQVVKQVVEHSPAQRAGFQVGDVIAQFDNVANPLYSDILASIRARGGKPIPVVVERGTETVRLNVTPESEVRLLGAAQPRIGVAFGAEDGRPVVADVAPGTPTAGLGLPRGAQILAVDGRPTQSWPEVFEALKTAAGSTTEVHFRAGADEAVGRLHVPSSVVNELGLPPTARIRSIDGEEDAVLESGQKVSLPAPLAVQKLLEKNTGRTVRVEYVPSMLDTQTVTRAFAVRRDNTDPWQLRASYGYELARGFLPQTVTIKAHGNPLRALAMGIGKTGDVLRQVYRIIKSMTKSALTGTKGNVSVQNVAGPIGIVRQAMLQAEYGYADLLFFLAFISVNLAVINFLPLPVVDGGLMVFLLLERIRGKPLSIKVQVVTTLAGLALIVLCFLLVTFQDIAKWVGGGL